MTGAALASSWMVEIGSYSPIRIVAASKAQARWRAFQAFRRDVARISFADFLHRGVTVRLATDFETATEPETDVSPAVVNCWGHS